MKISFKKSRVFKCLCLALFSLVVGLSPYILKAQNTKSTVPVKSNNEGSNYRKLNQTNLEEKILRIEILKEDERRRLPRLAQQHQDGLLESLEVKFESSDNNIQCYAAYLMGLYRLKDASIALSNNIGLQDKQGRGANLWWWGHYPAAEALVSIGDPAIPYMIANLTEFGDKPRRQLSLWVIHVIMGRDTVMTKHIVSKAVAKQTDKKKKDKLQAALTLIEAGQHEILPA